MAFIYRRTVYFRDTDAAGVVYFANILSICHEAYEASLAAASIDLQQFFTQPSIAFPITHTSGDFFRPMQCGETYDVHLTAELINEAKFTIHYRIFSSKTTDQLVGKAITQHVCIDAIARTKMNLPTEIQQWLKQWSQSSAEEG